MIHKGRVMLIDDSSTNIKILRKILKDDYTLEVAQNGKEALEKFNAFKPDLILLDIIMPEVSGYDVCKEIRSIEKFRSVKIIMVSAKNRADDRIMAYEAGADDYITKPFNKEELKAKVRVFMRSIDAKN